MEGGGFQSARFCDRRIGERLGLVNPSHGGERERSRAQGLTGNGRLYPLNIWGFGGARLSNLACLKKDANTHGVRVHGTGCVVEPTRFMSGKLGRSECFVESAKSGKGRGLRRKSVGQDRLKPVLCGVTKQEPRREERLVVVRAKCECPSVNCPERAPHKRIVDSVHKLYGGSAVV